MRNFTEDFAEAPVTVMFTDLVGSTDLATDRGDQAARSIHDAQLELVREHLEEHGGRIHDTAGDGVMAVFDSTRRAVACAVNIQRSVAGRNRKRANEAFSLRIGLNTGEVLKGDEEIFGAAVNAAARIAAKAEAGDILVSEVVKQLAGKLPGVEFRDRGRQRLKGFPERWRLYEVLWEDDAPAPVEEASPAGAAPGAQAGTFVGREREFAALTAALERALAGRGGLVMLVGDAGIGKTSLAEQLADAATQQGSVVARARCWEGGGAPVYWPWILAIRCFVDELGADALVSHMGTGAPYMAQMVPELGKLLTRTGPILREKDQDRFVMFDATATLLKNIAKEKTVVVLFDDLHAADEPSLHLLRFVARGLRTSRILIVGTYIDTEAKRSPALASIFGGLAREAERIELTGLDREAVTTLYEARTGQPIPEPLAVEIQHATEGNPFLIDEAVRMLSSEGQLRRPDHSLGFRVPEGARDLLRRRLASVSQEVIEILSVASVIGREFSVSTLSEVSGRDQERLLSILGDAVAAGILKEISALGRYAFGHILMRETLYEELRPADRMRIHREIGEVLEDRYQDEVDAHLDELAHHFFKAAQAGDQAKTLDYTLRAAKRAASSMAYEEAVRLYQRALRVAELAPISSTKRAQIQTALAEAQGRSAPSDGEQADAKAAAAANLFSHEGDFWTVSYEGKEIRLKDGKGPRYLAHLLKNPGRELHVLDLAALIEDHAGASSQSDSGKRPREPGLELSGEHAGDVLDAQAKAAYKQRLEDLQDDLREAEEFADVERAAQIRAERDALVDQLASGVGLGGRDRKAASVVEKARTSVTKAIKNTISKIETHHGGLGDHLTATVKTGIYCSYTPDPRAPITWQT